MKKLFFGLSLLLLAGILAWGWIWFLPEKKKETASPPREETEALPEAAAKTEAETTAFPSRPPLIRVDQIQTRRISPDCIRISWS